MTIEQLAEYIVAFWISGALTLFVYGWLNVPVLAMFAGHRLVQLFRHGFELRPTKPTHTALHLWCAFMYGLLMPSFYFLSVRTRHELALWNLGPHTNEWWTIAIGVGCMAWLTAHWIDAALRLGPLRFGRSWINRFVCYAAVFLCLRYHICTASAALAQGLSDAQGGLSQMIFGSSLRNREFWMLRIFYPQLCLLGPTMVFSLALLETDRPAHQPMPKRRWSLALPLSTVVIALLFLPFWLSIPRVTHKQAIALLEEHQQLVLTTAEEADLDPGLLAGVVYVAQTRDNPRFLGEPFERLALEIWQETAFDDVFANGLINPSVGLFQIRPFTAIQTLKLMSPLDWQNGLIRESVKYILTETHTWEYKSGLHGEIGASSKSQVARVLENPQNGAKLSAQMLWNFKAQWRDKGFPIDDRPEILATLYNIGYERSHPHGEPKANDFGRRVAEFMESEQCRALFPSPARGGAQ